MHKNSYIYKLLVTVLVGYMFYYRGFNLGILSAGVMMPTLSIIIFFIFFFSRESRCINVEFSLLVAILLFYTLTISLIHTENIVENFIFLLEVILSLIVYYIGYIAYKIYGLEFVAKSIAYSSIPILAIVIFLFIDNDAIRRIGAGDRGTGLNMGVNHLAQSVTIAFMSFFYLYKTNKSFMLLLLSGLTFFVALLPVSRASILGLLFSMGYYFRIKFIILMLFAVIVFSALWLFDKSIILENFITSRLFLVDSLSLAAESRLEVMYSNMLEVEYINFFTGQPWRYGPIDPNNGIMYPHNIVLSIFLHMGIIFAVSFSYYTFSVFFNIFRIGRFDISKVYLLSIFTVTILYSSTSGRLTRILVIFYILGIVQSYISGKKKLWRHCK